MVTQTQRIAGTDIQTPTDNESTQYGQQKCCIGRPAIYCLMRADRSFMKSSTGPLLD